MQRSPAIMNVAVPLLQHSQWFGHLALSADRVQLQFIQQTARAREAVRRGQRDAQPFGEDEGVFY
ncbi:MAG: hypothetical protein WDM80_04315 [Limisphaerales bacterium]